MCKRAVPRLRGWASYRVCQMTLVSPRISISGALDSNLMSIWKKLLWIAVSLLGLLALAVLALSRANR